MCAAGLPVCLTRAPKPILHPPPINKSDMKPVLGVSGTCRKTKKKHLRRGKKKELFLSVLDVKSGHVLTETVVALESHLLFLDGHRGLE